MRKWQAGGGLDGRNTRRFKDSEEYGRWKAGILSTYGPDNGEAAKLSRKIADRLRRLGFRMLTPIRNPR
jgi:hypothetical protein